MVEQYKFMILGARDFIVPIALRIPAKNHAGSMNKIQDGLDHIYVSSYIARYRFISRRLL